MIGMDPSTRPKELRFREARAACRAGHRRHACLVRARSACICHRPRLARARRPHDNEGILDPRGRTETPTRRRSSCRVGTCSPEKCRARRADRPNRFGRLSGPSRHPAAAYPCDPGRIGTCLVDHHGLRQAIRHGRGQLLLIGPPRGIGRRARGVRCRRTAADDSDADEQQQRRKQGDTGHAASTEPAPRAGVVPLHARFTHLDAAPSRHVR